MIERPEGLPDVEHRVLTRPKANEIAQRIVDAFPEVKGKRGRKPNRPRLAAVAFYVWENRGCTTEELADHFGTQEYWSDLQRYRRILWHLETAGIVRGERHDRYVPPGHYVKHGKVLGGMGARVDAHTLLWHPADAESEKEEAEAC